MSVPNKETATAAFARQIAIIKSLSNKGIGHPEFITWKKGTHEILHLYLRGSALALRFDEICFDRTTLASPANIHRGEDFIKGLALAEICLQEAMDYIETFGMKKGASNVR